MNFNLFVAASALTFLCLNSVSAKQWTVGDWTGSDVLDEGGKFSHCGAATEYGGDYLIITMHKGGKLFLNVKSAKLALTKGIVSTFYSTDNGPVTRLLTLALESSAVTSSLGGNEGFLDRVKKANKITFYVEGDYSQTFAAPKAPVLEKIFSCYLTYEPPTQEEMHKLKKQ